MNQVFPQKGYSAWWQAQNFGPRALAVFPKLSWNECGRSRIENLFYYIIITWNHFEWPFEHKLSKFKCTVLIIPLSLLRKKNEWKTFTLLLLLVLLKKRFWDISSEKKRVKRRQSLPWAPKITKVAPPLHTARNWTLHADWYLLTQVGREIKFTESVHNWQTLLIFCSWHKNWWSSVHLSVH